MTEAPVLLEKSERLTAAARGEASLRVRQFGAVNWLGLWTLYLREVRASEGLDADHHRAGGDDAAVPGDFLLPSPASAAPSRARRSRSSWRRA